MQRKILPLLLAGALLLPVASRAHTEASTLSALSAVPVASVLGGASVAAAALVVVPAALSTAGAVLVVKAVEVSARGTVLVLERASDGARVSIEIAGRGAEAGAPAVGSALTVGVMASGVLLSAAGEVIAFLPNALGQALLHNERVTR